MADYKCESCPMRAKYDNKPTSFVGRFGVGILTSVQGGRHIF